MSQQRTRVAIACQGGGSHTAFTAGVLRRLFREQDREYEVVGISGTSGGALCAALSWYGLHHPDEDPGDLLTQFWADLSARSPADRSVNEWVRWETNLRRLGVPMADVNPSTSPGSRWGQDHLRSLLRRYIDFDVVPELAADTEMALLVSAIEVLSGEFELFREHDLSPEVLLASTAEPNLFDAVEIDGRVYWDGLFAKNPPIQDFSTTADIPDPDEVWLIKINPQERVHVPRTLDGIMDRRNELSGNLSLNAEVQFVRQVNEWIAQGYLPDRYTHTDIKRIRFKRSNLDWRSKLDRDPAFIERLIRDGEEQAESFLAEQ
jgi:NTE family protein